MAFGLLPTGFVRKTTADILAEIEADQLVEIDPELNVQPETPIGQFNGIFASKLAECWELAEAVNSAQNPDNATGFALDGISGLTGTFRHAATKGTVILTLNLNAGVTVPAGSIAAVAGDGSNRWVLVEAATNSGGAPADIDAEAEAEVAGNTPANSGTITVIVTPVAGWNTVTNALDADAGTEIDTDAQLRVRREAELSRAGSATLPAIRADLLAVAGVVSVSVFHNPTDYQVGSLPAHSVEAVVLGGADQAVGEALFATVAGGIETFGTVDIDVADPAGNPQRVSFSRPTEIDLYLEVDVDVDAADFPANGDDLIATAIAAYGAANYEMGGDVILSKLACIANQTAGVVDVTEIRVGTSPSPSQTTNYIIEPRELAVLDFSRITVASTPV